MLGSTALAPVGRDRITEQVKNLIHEKKIPG